MDLYAQLFALMDQRELTGLKKMEVISAIRHLQRVLGPVGHFSTQEPELAQTMQIPGDDATWVIYGHWADGTVDAIREQGSFSEDTVIGYRLGDTLEVYNRKLRAEA